MQLVSTHFSTASFTFFDTPTICKSTSLPSVKNMTSTGFASSSLLLIYLHRKDERLSRPGWLTYSGRFTHISGHPSAAGRAQEGRAQDSESSPVIDRRSTTVPRNQPETCLLLLFLRE